RGAENHVAVQAQEGGGGPAGGVCYRGGGRRHPLPPSRTGVARGVRGGQRARERGRAARNWPEGGEEDSPRRARPNAEDSARGGAYRALTPDYIKGLQEFKKRGTGTVEGGLNLLGDEGWELVAVEPAVVVPPSLGGERPALYVFKRPKQ